MDKTTKYTREAQEDRQKTKVKEFFKLGEVGGYFFRGNDPSRPKNFNIRAMHTINKISIVVFLLGIIYLIIKHIR